MTDMGLLPIRFPGNTASKIGSWIQEFRFEGFRLKKLEVAGRRIILESGT